MSTDTSLTPGPPGEAATSLDRSINWRGAFVMGLAGVILVTGITPFAVQAMGAAAIPCLIGIQIIALVVCLCMGEMAALWPHRTGGTPSYAYEAYKPLGASTARHIGGVSGWSYWLGWFPVAPINMILAASYIAVLFHVPLGRIVDPLGGLGTPEGIGVLIITLVGLVVLFVPCYLGVRLGTGFATVLGIVSMVPITLLVILPVFKPSTFHWSNVSGFHFADPKTAGFAFVMSWLFVMSWNGIGVEAAACYVAECRDPHRDAKIALTAEGLYGLFIYAATAIVFVAVLGASLTSSDPLTLYTSFADHIFGSAGWVKYLIGIPLIGALLLSVLNAIMGVGRSLFQASEDGLIPKFFGHKNKHHSPDYAMFFNLACAMLVALFGSPVRIYIFSNVGYLIAIIAALFGYFMLRQFSKDLISPFRLPGYVRWIALAMGVFLTFVYFEGGWGSPDIVVGPGQGHTLYLLGFAVVAAYIPLHLWRRMTDRRDGVEPVGTQPTVVGSPGGTDFGDMKEPHVVDPAQMDAIDMEPTGISPAPVTPPMRADAQVNVRSGDVVAQPNPKPARRLFGRAKWDAQPTQSSAVLIATVGITIPPAVIARAVQLSGGRPVAVLTIARIYGYSFGLPSPGLLPTPKEMDEQLALVAKAIARLERRGVEAWGQVASTRRYAKTIAQAARARGVDHVLVVAPEVPRWRRLVEGDTARDVRRRIGQEAEVEGITV